MVERYGVKMIMQRQSLLKFLLDATQNSTMDPFALVLWDSILIELLHIEKCDTLFFNRVLKYSNIIV